jgi:hypothetical protein
VREERGGRGWVGDCVMRVDICEMGGVGEIAMEETGEENKLDGGREERGNYVETYLVSGLWMERERVCVWKCSVLSWSWQFA